jgi:hypothetical protein
MMKTLDELYEVAKGIAMFLGRGWEAKRREIPDHPGCGDALLVNGPYSVEIRTSDRSQYRGKYLFIPRWPRTASDSVLGPHVTYSPLDNSDGGNFTPSYSPIAVSQTKTEQQMALDFERRLEDRYIKAFDAAQQRLWREQDNRQDQLNKTVQLAALLGSQALDCNREPTDQPVVSAHGVYKFSVNHDGTRVERIEIHNIPVSVADTLFQILAREVTK